MFKQVHHIGFAVYDLEKVIDLMKKVYNVEPERRIVMSDRQMEAILFKTGETYLEYLAPLSEESTLTAYLQEKGEGFHHIAYLVESIDNAKKIMPTDAVIRERESNVGDWKIADIDTKYAFGITSQIIQK
jgi:methylmalonyl-CoA/ethylmalonyl-CoA epimerase